MKNKTLIAKKAKRVHKKRKLLFIVTPIICIVAIFFVWIAADVIVNISIKEAPRRPPKGVNFDFSEMYKLVWLYGNKGAHNPDINYTIADVDTETVKNAVLPLKQYMDGRYDCADFRATYLLKLYFDGGEEMLSLSPDGSIKKLLEEALTGFKFWITSDGDDSMCYYSENHQINFFVLEYLSGLAFQNSTFSTDGKNGKEHMRLGRNRIMDWLELRYTYGFSECFSANYYVVDIVALTMLLNYGDRTDTALMQRAKMVLDIIFMDYAMQMYDYTFISPSGRAYQYNNLCWDTSESAKIVDHMWGLNRIENNEYICDSLAAVANNNMDSLKSGAQPFYEIPEVILEIGRSNNKIVKTGTGLNLADFEADGLLGQSDRQMMFQLGMGAITNPEIIQNTLDYINRYDLLTNNFLANFKFINIKSLQMFGLMPALMKLANPYTNGFANQKYNVYTYMTDSFKLSTNQQYFPGSFGSQQIQAVALLPGGIPVYTTHPVDTLTATPGYWCGYGAAPHNAQNENVLMSVYNLPKKIMMSQDTPLDYTHTYFPESEMDEIVLDGNYAFARKEDTYIAVMGTSKLEYLERDESRLEGLDYKTSKRFDLIQRGKEQGWIYELSDKHKDGSFEEFVTRIKNNKTSFDGAILSYTTAGKTMQLNYGEGFSVDGNLIDTDYKRYDCEFITANRYEREYVYSYNGHSLKINLQNNVREYD